MKKLENYIYQEDLGGLCPICSDYGYNIFAIIDGKILQHATTSVQNQLLQISAQAKRHYKRIFEDELIITQDGTALHDNCINHCILHAFGECQQEHTMACTNCYELYDLLKQLQQYKIFTFDEVNTFRQKLLYWISHQVRKTYLSPQLNIALRNLDEYGAILLYNYKMKVTKKSAKEKKSDFFAKRGWSLHTILVLRKDKHDTNMLNVEAYDHWSNDSKQDYYWTASAFDTVFTTILTPENNIQWIKIFSDNGPHYHSKELMIMISKWNLWYDIEIRSQNFFKAGEAKSLVDTHHATISKAFNRYVRIGGTIDQGQKIEEAIKDLAEIYVSYIKPNRDIMPTYDIDDYGKQLKPNEKFLKGIRSWHYFTWPIDDDNKNSLVIYEMPGIGNPIIWSEDDIIQQNRKSNYQKPIPAKQSTSTISQKPWITPIPKHYGKYF